MRNIHYLLFIILCFAACAPKADHLTILHTNDTHSQVEPKSNGQGGYARRMGLIRQERLADKHLLLVDAGDFCQGTPYFNFYHGRVEIDAMNLMGYDAALIADKNFLPAKYLDPYTSAQEAVDKLRAEKCDIVVCLSHLGTYGKAAEDVCDVQLVQNTRGIDAVIGGHTHKLYDNLRVPNLDGDSIPVCQMGKSGAYLGKIVLGLGDKNEK